MRLLILFASCFLVSSVSFAGNLEDMVAEAINNTRRTHRLVVLKRNPRLEAAAESQSEWMASVGRMDHMRPRPNSFQEFVECEHHPSNRVIKSGYFKFEELFRVEKRHNGPVVFPLPAANQNVGEIIARGVGGQGAYNHKVVVEGWMNSPGHRTEILTDHYREMGVSVKSPRFGETYWCVVFANR